MFSNESNFQVFKMGSTTKRHPNLSGSFDPRYTVPTIKHLQPVMVWGMFFWGKRQERPVLSPPKQKDER